MQTITPIYKQTFNKQTNKHPQQTNQPTNKQTTTIDKFLLSTYFGCNEGLYSAQIDGYVFTRSLANKEIDKPRI